ncbi:MAG TPA: PAS domain S-box protein [Steroidobacteraceae bacterium]|nr:PAS domain S-box protein [Steroidobacteraceae bacterium]
MSLVLVVYDQEPERQAIEKLLAARGHTVLKAANGLEALDLVRREHPDAALSDVLLPRMDGFALCRKWKQDDRLQTAPFIFYTTRYDDPKYQRFADEVGADRFFARPESTDVVIEALDEALEANRRGTGTMRMAADEVLAAFEKEKERERAQELERQQLRERAKVRAMEQARAREKLLEKDRERDKAVAALRTRVAELEAGMQRHVAAEGAYRALFESAPLPMWIQEEETGRFVAVNDAAMTRYGYGRAEFLALDLKALQPGDERPITATYDRPSPRRHRRKDGALLEVELSVQSISWHGRRALLVVAHDVTERLRALRALAEREETQRRVVASLPDAVLLLDAEARVTDVNDAACDLTGFRRDELIGRAQEDLVRGLAGPAVGGAAGSLVELTVKDREPLEVELRSMPLAGESRGHVTVLRDVSVLTREDPVVVR